MKRILFAIILLFVCAVAVPSWAEELRCNILDSYSADGPGNNDRRAEACRSYCKGQSQDCDSLLSEGLSVEEQRPVVVTQNPFPTNLVNVPDEGSCTCSGTEYILKRGGKRTVY
jgi:hypothetical protein